MLLIDCPCCGPRDQSEFRCGGEAHIVRPESPETASDQAWAEYLFYRTNSKGIGYERWQHVYGCRLWFNVARSTVTHEILAVYGMGEPPPIADAGADPAAGQGDGA